MIDLALLTQWLDEGKTVWQIMDQAVCCRNTVINHMKKHNLESPAGFFQRPDRKVGRPPGFAHTEEHKRLMSAKFSGADNPFFGRSHDAGTRQRMRDNHADITGEKNPFHRSLADPAKREAHRERARQRWRCFTGEQRAAIIEKTSRTLCLVSYQRTHVAFVKHLHGRYACAKAQGVCFYRSSWELRTILALEECDQVEAFRTEPFAVPYVDKHGQPRWTKPDFLVKFTSGEAALFEVKPTALLDYYNSRERIVGCRDYCRLHRLQFAVLDDGYFKPGDALPEILSRAFRGELDAE